MTKQSELREGIEERIRLGIIEQRSTYEIADAVLKYEDSQGVVLRVERELPYEVCQGCTCYFVKDGRALFKERLDKARYVAVEPLIEEVSDE